ncbi:MAG: hypothetical protein PHO92_00900 [Candidatus Peribacteraceae bacterium]|nr:hypothetical protein [Candidatus Peribacteraceae bacterium]
MRILLLMLIVAGCGVILPERSSAAPVRPAARTIVASRSVRIQYPRYKQTKRCYDYCLLTYPPRCGRVCR